MIAKQPSKFWEIAQLSTIPQKTSKAIITAYKQKFGAKVWQLFHVKIDCRRQYLPPVVYGMLAQLVWFEENNFVEPIVDISANEKMIYIAQLREFSCEDTSEFHAYLLGVFYAWWIDTFNSTQVIRLKQAVKGLNLEGDK